MDQKEFSEIIDLIRKEDPRYDRQAYFFMRGALGRVSVTMLSINLVPSLMRSCMPGTYSAALISERSCST